MDVSMQEKFTLAKYKNWLLHGFVTCLHNDEEFVVA